MSQEPNNGTVALPTDELGKYLCVQLASKSYAVNINRVKEIIEYMDVTPVPMMPDFFCGAINLRGRAVPVIDIAARMGISQTQIGRRTCIVIIEVELQESYVSVGVLVDAVNRVANISRDTIEVIPSFDGCLNTDFIEGMAKIDDGFIILLHVDKLLSLSDINALTSLQNSSEIDASITESSTDGDTVSTESIG